MPGPAPLRPTWPRLRPAAAAWTLHPALPVLLVALVAIAVFVAAGRPQLWPGYRQLIWSEHTGLVLLAQATIAWSLLGIHELAHLITARAAGVPGRITFGTRLQFLVAQTEVPGIWAAPRRHRLTIYAAGMATDVALASAAVLTAANTGAGSVVHRVALIVTTTVTITLTIQLMAFMRTDIYFLIQDLTGCRTLYADATAHARHLAARTAAWLRRRPAPGFGPLAALPARETKIVRAYTVLLLAGTVLCLTGAAAVTIPFDLHLLTAATGRLFAPDASVAVRVLDGGAVLVVLLIPQVLWARAWWRRHGHHLHSPGSPVCLTARTLSVKPPSIPPSPSNLGDRRSSTSGGGDSGAGARARRRGGRLLGGAAVLRSRRRRGRCAAPPPAPAARRAGPLTAAAVLGRSRPRVPPDGPRTDLVSRPAEQEQARRPEGGCCGSCWASRRLPGPCGPG